MNSPRITNSACSTCLVLGAGALWGVISLFVRSLSAAGLSSLQISGVRLCIGAAGMLLVLLVADRSKLKVRLRDLWMFAGTGIVSITLFNTCYFTCMQLSEASIAVVLLYTSPVWVTLLSALLFKERITPAKAVALVATMAGSALVAGVAGGAVRLSAAALGIGLASGLFYALYSIFARYALARYHTLTVTFYTFLAGALCSLAVSDVPATAATLMANGSALAAALGIGVLCTILPYLLYTQGLKDMETGKAAILAMAEPLVGTLLGLLVYHESAGPLKLLGIALLFAGVIALNLPAGKGSREREGSRQGKAEHDA